MIRKLKVAILSGGKSSEHEVSLQSGINVINAIDKNKYDVVSIGINKAGVWFLYDSLSYLENENDPTKIKLKENAEKIMLLPQNNGEVYSFKQNKVIEKIDVVFSVLHGTNGEDGNTQGFLNIVNVPYVGSGVLGSSVGMDKDIAKRLLRDAGISIANYVSVNCNEIYSLDEIITTLGLPLFIKPANQGSSVGVSKAYSKKELEQSIILAFKYDSKVLIEEFIKGREIECGVLGNNNPIASIVGEIAPTHDFYSYEAKYIDANGAKAIIPANISEDLTIKVQNLSIKTFKSLSCSGLARVDFFLKEDGDLVINEINTLPGFTKISMYPQMWQASGISYPELITKLIDLSLEKFNEKII